jgi:integrase
VVADLTRVDSAALQPLDEAASFLEDLEGGSDLERAAAAVLRSRPAPTRRAYGKDWRAFRAWCRRRQVSSLPADPQTIADYLDEHAGVLAVSTLKRRLTAISQIHKAAGRASPTLTLQARMAWRLLLDAYGDRPVRQVDPAHTSVVQALVGTCDSSLLGRRDRALLLLGFAGFLGPSTLTSLDLADLTEVEEGIELLLRKPRPGRPAGVLRPIPRGQHASTCPVRAVRAWVAAAGLVDGPLFRSVDRYGNVGHGRLADSTVARIIKRAAAQAGLDPAAFSGFSLRAGLATAAAAAGVPAEVIMRQGGWTTYDAVRPHLRRGAAELWDYVAAAQVGL